MYPFNTKALRIFMVCYVIFTFVAAIWMWHSDAPVAVTLLTFCGFMVTTIFWNKRFETSRMTRKEREKYRIETLCRNSVGRFQNAFRDLDQSMGYKLLQECKASSVDPEGWLLVVRDRMTNQRWLTVRFVGQNAYITTVRDEDYECDLKNIHSVKHFVNLCNRTLFAEYGTLSK